MAVICSGGGTDPSASPAPPLPPSRVPTMPSASAGSNAPPTVFIIAGQSNAEGCVRTSGIMELAAALPEDGGRHRELSSAERIALRRAEATGAGLYCQVDENCLDDPNSCSTKQPFTTETSDAVINELISSKVDWSSFATPGYTHPSVLIQSANYRYAQVLSEYCGTANYRRTGPSLNGRPNPAALGKLGAGYATSRLSDGQQNRVADPSWFGPELTFGAALGATISNTVLVKITMGGSSLGDHWRPSGTLYKAMLSETRAVLNFTGGKLGGLMWFQGFNDMFTDGCGERLSDNYAPRLQALIADVRADFGTPGLPVVIVKARYSSSLAPIQQAQKVVAAADDYTVTVPSADLSECFHYSAGAQLVIGERAASAMLPLYLRFSATTSPSAAPSRGSSYPPSGTPSDAPSSVPSNTPSGAPSDAPSLVPSNAPSGAPSDGSTSVPSTTPSMVPSAIPTNVPSGTRSAAPSITPSAAPSESSTHVPNQAVNSSDQGYARLWIAIGLVEATTTAAASVLFSICLRHFGVCLQECHFLTHSRVLWDGAPIKVFDFRHRPRTLFCYVSHGVVRRRQWK